MKTAQAFICPFFCIVLMLCCALPGFCAAAENAEDKTPVFDNVREELTIAYAGEDSLDDKYVLAFASIPNGDPVGYKLYRGSEFVKIFTDEEPYVTISSPSGEYKVVAYNLKDESCKAESGPIKVETENVNVFVKLRRLFSSLYLDTVVPGAVIWAALSQIPAVIARWFAGLSE